MAGHAEVTPRSDARQTLSGASWVEEVTGALVERSAPLVGGMSSEVVKHRLSDGRTVVSRHITNTDWLEREPHLIDAEASALRLLAQSEITAPQVLALDAVNGRLAMSFVDGEMLVSAQDLRDRVAAIADVALRVSRVELPDDHGLPTWRPWVQPSPKPPVWGDHELWAEAIARFESTTEPTTHRPALLHRDLHPLNLLWHNAEPNVVDWVNACVGHPHAELGHCRWNLTVMAGTACASAFLDAYLLQSGDGPYDPYWDLAPALSFLPGPFGLGGWHAVGRTDLTSTVVVERTEAFLRAALVDRAGDTSNDHPDD